MESQFSLSVLVLNFRFKLSRLKNMTMAHLPGRKNLALTLSALHILSSILTKSHTHYVSQVKSIYVPLNPRRELSMEQGGARLILIFMDGKQLLNCEWPGETGITSVLWRPEKQSCMANGNVS
ncbi:unnamed protein product [Orchesella dallaii]|uniref:Uncharacterized protein n=1 Tax=Orchesella dallaii TaxID=48710 RepID=A0ABP1R1D8_9HEXA